MRREAGQWARRVRRSFKRSTMEDVRGNPIPAEEWIKRAWGKVENEERKMLVEGIDDPAAEGGDQWGAMGERGQLMEEKERKKRELSESGKAKT